MTAQSLPSVVAHADWSAAPAKRWLACATRLTDGPNAGSYRLAAPEPVGDIATLFDRLRRAAGPNGVFLGVDFPLGLPLAYAQQTGIPDFLALLPRLGRDEWRDFYTAAGQPEDISLYRPFYPARPGGARLQYLLDGLNLRHRDNLYRVCDRGHAHRRAAAPLFWTMGAQQVGKAAISGWRDLLAPALQRGEAVHLWPFAGSLDTLLARGDLVVAEAYPAEFYAHLGLTFASGGGGKRNQLARAAQAAALLNWAAEQPAQLADDLAAAIHHGFDDHSCGEDQFDAVVGLVGMLNVLFGRRPPGEPADERRCQIEGWILGQSPAAEC